MPDITFDFDGLIALLAKNIYSEKSVFLRELIQNGHDSILRRRAAEPDGGAGESIDIECAVGRNTLVVRDNGLGMDRDEIEGYLSVIGRSGTKKSKVAGTIGQFGIGFLSAFLVADKVEVVTRRAGDANGWRWSNAGSREYHLAPCDKDTVGTEVRLHVQGPANQAEITPEAVKRAIKRYADMLSIPVLVNGHQVNRVTMPWEEDLSAPEGLAACGKWISETFGDTPLEIIPVHSQRPKVDGVLYVTRHRVLESDRQTKLKVTINRMFICEDRDVLRPQWAFFLGGAIESPDLTPTAGREEVRRDATASAVTRMLSEAVIAHFDHLRTADPDRLLNIVRHHDLGIKAACHNVPELFTKLINVLHWRVNDGRTLEPEWRTLPDIVAESLRNDDGHPLLACFTTSDVANQNFQLANAAGRRIIDASRGFDEDLLIRYVHDVEPGAQLVRVDFEDGWEIFGKLSAAESARFAPLATTLSNVIGEQSRAPVVVDVRSFLPVDIPALIRRPSVTPGMCKALNILDDPNAAPDMKVMAQELVRRGGLEPVRFVLNAGNLLVRQLAAEDQSDPDVRSVAQALFQSTVLGAGEAASPDVARDFRADLHRLLERHLALVSAVRLRQSPQTSIN